jgi:hypothetical protein
LGCPVKLTNAAKLLRHAVCPLHMLNELKSGSADVVVVYARPIDPARFDLMVKLQRKSPGGLCPPLLR